MQKKFVIFKLMLGFCAPLLFFNCKDSSKSASVKQETEQQNQINANAPAYETVVQGKKGILGVYNVPEMLSLCKVDSTKMENLSTKITQNFSILEKDLLLTNSEVDKSQGIIYYVSKPGNLKFECFLLIKKIPTKNPYNSQIVVLEAATMVIYDYYGRDKDTYKAYEEIKVYCKNNQLEQSGPMRELYPISANEEKNQSAWFTRIMLPVVKINPG